jgi:hypothetical protein
MADWDECEKHRLATSTYKETDIEMTSDTMVCMCCGKPIPQ